MNKRKDLLNALADFWDEMNSLQLLNKMEEYYRINDLETGNTHFKIFNLLYISGEKLTYDEIAERHHINVYTLDRYRQRYNKLAIKLMREDAQPHKNCEIK